MKLVEALAQEMAEIYAKQGNKAYQPPWATGYKHDASGTPIEVGYSHGPGGNLTFPGVDPAMFHTIMGADSLLGRLPTVGSLETNPTYQTVTGVQGDTGNEKVDPCDDSPVAGLMKACMLTSVFGRYERATGELELNRLGQVNDRADPMDLAMVGSPIHDSGLFSSGAHDPSVPGNVFVNELARKLWERNVSVHRLLSQQLWTGNPSNNTAGAGYKELTSFSILVNTGHVDAENNQSCPALDSYVADANYTRVDGGGTQLVARITDMYYQVRDRARRTGVDPVRWLFVMKPQLFYELTAVWPCSYLTYRCEVQGQERVNIDGADQVKMRDELRNGQFLLIDGVRVPVVLDDGIPEDGDNDNANVPAGCFATDIYLIPMSVTGGRAVTFLEYFQYSNPSINSALGTGMVQGKVEGAFLSWPRQTNQCFQIQTKIEPRLVMRTPWLASRLQNVMYCPIQHVRDAFPGEDYFTDGGRTSRPGPSYYSLWQS